MQQLLLPPVGRVNADYTFSRSASLEVGGCCAADNSNGPTTLRGVTGDGVHAMKYLVKRQTPKGVLSLLYCMVVLEFIQETLNMLFTLMHILSASVLLPGIRKPHS